MSTTPSAPAPTSAPASNTGSPGATGTQNGAGTQAANVGQPAPTPQQQIQELLQKVGGLEVKAGGKTHKIDSVEKLLAAAQRGIPLDQTFREINEQRNQLAPFAQALQALQSGDDAQAEQLLERILTPQRLRAIAETRLRREFEQEQRLANLSPRERELYLRMQQLSQEKAQWEQHQRRIQEQEGQLQQQQQVQALKSHMGQAINKSLEMLGLPPKLEPIAVEFMKPLIRSMMSNGMQLDPQVLSQKAGEMLDELLTYKAKNLEGEKLLKYFGDDTGKKYRSALLSTLNAGNAGKSQPNPFGQSVQKNQNTKISPTSEGDRQGDKKKVVPDFRKPLL